MSDTNLLMTTFVSGCFLAAWLLAQARRRRTTASAAEVLRCATNGCLVHQGSSK